MDKDKRDEARKEISRTISHEDYEKKVRWLITTFRGLEMARIYSKEDTAKAIGCILVIDGIAQGKIKMEKVLPVDNQA